MSNLKWQTEIGLCFPTSSKLRRKTNYEDYAKRIQKTLYYGRLPSTDRPSLPVTGILVDKFSKFCKRDGINQLNLHEASSICYDACVTPCSVIVALLYLDRLRAQNPDYLAKSSPSQVFIVSLMVASKYLFDDGEEDEVFNEEWATSAAMLLSDLNEAEKDFLAAIDWNLFVDGKSFAEGLRRLESSVAFDQGTLRGFFVYSDVVALSEGLPALWDGFLSLVGSALVACFVGYTFTIYAVAAGLLVTRECSQLATVRARLELIPSHGVLQNKVDLQGRPRELLDARVEGVVPGNGTEEDFGALVFEEEEEEEKDEGRPPPPSRFGALRTLTAALLLASSSNLIERPSFASATFATGSVGCCSSFPSRGLGGYPCVDFLPRVRTEARRGRRWRKLSGCSGKTLGRTGGVSGLGIDSVESDEFRVDASFDLDLEPGHFSGNSVIDHSFTGRPMMDHCFSGNSVMDHSGFGKSRGFRCRNNHRSLSSNNHSRLLRNDHSQCSSTSDPNLDCSPVHHPLSRNDHNFSFVTDLRSLSSDHNTLSSFVDNSTDYLPLSTNLQHLSISGNNFNHSTDYQYWSSDYDQPSWAVDDNYHYLPVQATLVPIRQPTSFHYRLSPVSSFFVDVGWRFDHVILS